MDLSHLPPVLSCQTKSRLEQEIQMEINQMSSWCHPCWCGVRTNQSKDTRIQGQGFSWMTVSHRSQECHWNGSPPDRELHLYIFLVFGGKNLFEYACIQNIIRCWSCCKCKGSMYDSNVSSCWKTFNSISWRLTLKVSLNVSRVQAQCVAGIQQAQSRPSQDISWSHGVTTIITKQYW